jgi:pyrroline-5-carboxylate reductase
MLKGKLLLSIAAGVPCSYYEARAEKGARIALAMPSLAAEIGKAATVYYTKSWKDDAIVRELLQPTGILIKAKQERMLDAAFLHSSGMAFFFPAIGAMIQAGRRAGLSEENSRLLCASAAQGAGELMLHTKKSPMELEQNEKGNHNARAEGAAKSKGEECIPARV